MEEIKLGEQIILTGFKSLDGGTMHILRKVIGSEVRKLSDKCEQFQELRLVMKHVHGTEASEIYEIHGHLTDNGKNFVSKVEDRNVFMAVSKVLEKLEREMEHKA